MRTILMLFCVITIGFSFAQASETANGFKKDTESFKVEMNEKIKKLDAKIEELKISGTEAQKKTIVEIEEAREKIRTQLTTLEKQTATGWKKFKIGFANSVDKLNKKVQESLKN